MCDAPQPLVSTALWRGGQGVTSLHCSHDSGTARQQHLAHTRTPDPMPTPLRAWGAERGRLRARAAVPRPPPLPNRDRAPPPVSWPAQTLLDRPICYSCRKLSAFAPVGRTGARFGFGASRSRSNRTRTRAFGARRSAPSHASQAQSTHRRPACSAAHGGRGRGTLVGAAPSRPARVRSRLARPSAT